MAPKAEIYGFKAFAEAAKAVSEQFSKENILCINSLKKVTERCDCSSPSPPVSKDIGYIYGTEPLSIDIETGRLLREAKARMNWQMCDKFERIASAILK